MRSQRGSMLILALWGLSLLTVFSVSLGFGVRQKAALLSRLSALDAVYPIAYSGVEQAKSLVRADVNFDVDTLTDVWATQSATYQQKTLEGGHFSLVTDRTSPVVDEERKVNLNHTGVDIVSRLLQRVAGLSRDDADELAYNLIDWMDSDSAFGHPEYGAEDGHYEDLRLPYSAKDAPYEVMDEILLVEGMTPAIFDRISSYITIFGTGKVNLNTAGGEVLSALGLSPAAVDSIVEYRAGEDGQEGTPDDRYFLNVENVGPDLERAELPFDMSQTVLLAGLEASERVGIVSSMFRVVSLGTAERTGAAVEVEAVFDRKSNIVYLHEGDLRWPARN